MSRATVNNCFSVSDRFALELSKSDVRCDTWLVGALSATPLIFCKLCMCILHSVKICIFKINGIDKAQTSHSIDRHSLFLFYLQKVNLVQCYGALSYYQWLMMIYVT